MLELFGIHVEVAPAGFELTQSPLDRILAGGLARLAADPRRALLHVAGVGTFAIADGARVAFEPAPGVGPDLPWTWLYGTVAAVLLGQQGRFALHASVVDVDGNGIAVAGARGAGKSTTALRLAQVGRPLVTDDVSPLRFSDGVATVEPYGRPVHAFAETADRLGVDVARARPILPGHAKLAVPVPPHRCVELGAVAVLEPFGDRLRVERLRGGTAHWRLVSNAYRADIVRELWEEELFAWASRLAGMVPVHLVRRPTAGWSADAVARAVERISRSRIAP
jgi:hypothetical protein